MHQLNNVNSKAFTLKLKLKIKWPKCYYTSILLLPSPIFFTVHKRKYSFIKKIHSVFLYNFPYNGFYTPLALYAVFTKYYLTSSVFFCC